MPLPIVIAALTILRMLGIQRPFREHAELPKRRGRFEAKAFEPNVQDFDRLLNQRLKTICKGC
jgi:hypothetical protein